MHFSPVSKAIAKARSICHVGLTLILIAVLTGGLGFAIQGVAWIQMAREAGGMNRLTDAMFEFAPCEHCRVARELSRPSSGDDENPLSTERPESPRLCATLTATSLLQEAPCRLLNSAFPHDHSERSPRSHFESPQVPPPRGFGLS